MALSNMNVQYNIPADNPVFIEGYEFADTNTLIYPEIKKRTETKDYNGKKTLFIYTTE